MKAFAKVLCVLGAGVFTAATSASAAPQDWRTYTDPVHGARALVPSHLFSPAEWRKEKYSDFKWHSPAVNSFFLRLMKTEAKLMAHFDLPMGVSLIGVFKKQDI